MTYIRAPSLIFGLIMNTACAFTLGAEVKSADNRWRLKSLIKENVITNKTYNSIINALNK